jgi:hypothetical protein
MMWLLCVCAVQVKGGAWQGQEQVGSDRAARVNLALTWRVHIHGAAGAGCECGDCSCFG